MSYGLRRAVDPFHEDPLPRAFYHPSSKRRVDGKDKKNHLSPERVKNQTETSMALTPEEEAFLHGSYKYQKSFKPLTSEHAEIGQEENGSSRFDESWPDSERPSSPSGCYSSHNEEDGFNSPMLDEIKKANKSRGSISTLFSCNGESTSPSSTLDKIKGRLNFDDLLKPEKEAISETASKAKTTEHSSTLSKYIERFRTGVPKSREERQQENAVSKKDFWWLDSTRSPSTPPSSSTPKQDNAMKSGNTKTRSRITKTADIKDKAGLSTLTKTNLESSGLTDRLRHENPWSFDEHTFQLQQRADLLLEQTESSLSSVDPAVSTDGLGQSSSNTASSVSEVAYMPNFVKRTAHERLNVPLKPARKEDDILYQWRLKRKIELAKERVCSIKQSNRDSFRATKHILTNTGSENKPATEAIINSKLAEFHQRLGDDNVIPVSCNFTPAPGRSSQNMAVPLIQQAQVPIASPFISGSEGLISQSTGLCPVQPHLHLACDILPNKKCHYTEMSDISHANTVTCLEQDGNVSQAQGQHGTEGYKTQTHSEAGASCLHVQQNRVNTETCTSCSVDKLIEKSIQTNEHREPCGDSVRVGSQEGLCKNCKKCQLKTEKYSSSRAESNHGGQQAENNSCESALTQLAEAKQEASDESLSQHSLRSALHRSHDVDASPLDHVSGSKGTSLSTEDQRTVYVEDMVPEKDHGVDIGNNSNSKKHAYTTHHSSNVVSSKCKQEADVESQISLTDVSDIDEDQVSRTKQKEQQHRNNKQTAAAVNVDAGKGKRLCETSGRNISSKTSKSNNKQSSVKSCLLKPKRAEFKERKPHLREPHDHSTPSRPLSCAIGQVVREHLLSSFSADSDTSLQLSVNTLPQDTPAASPEHPDGGVAVPIISVQNSAENGKITHIKIGNENIWLSDGEEFADDELLRTLRDRRQHYLHKLAELDNC